MDNDERILQAIDALYGAALDPDAWPHALDCLAGATGGAGALVLSISSVSSSSIASTTLGEAASDYADNGWWSRDVLREGANRLGLGKGLYCHRDLVSEETIKQHPFFQEFLCRHGLQAMATYAFKPKPECLLTVTVPRATRHGDFASSQIDTLRILGPHVARAFSIAGQVVRTGIHQASLDTLFDQFAFATLLVDRKLRVKTLNLVARSLLGDGFTIERGFLRATTTAGQRALETVLKASFDTPLVAPRRSLVPRPDGRPALLVQAFRIGHGSTTSILELFSDDLAVIVFTDTDCVSRSDPMLALQAMGLTPAEARVAASLGTGYTTSQTAEHLGVTVGTVRVHLKNIFSKLDLHRQSDLARLAARLTVFR